MTGFYHAIEELQPSQQNMALTVLSEEHFGEKALVSDHKIVWESAENGFFTLHREEMEKISDSGRLVIGEQEVFCEIIGQEKKLVICGGGHVSIPIIKMGKMCGFHVTVLEDRPQFADNARRAGAVEVICEPFAEGLKKIEGDEDTFFVIVTRGHRFDQVCLESIAGKKHAYIGMLGSRKRVKLVRESVIKKGRDPEVVNHIYSPIGMDIGAETPEEIAVAIMAEIIGVKNQKKRDGGYSREILQEIGKEKYDNPGNIILATIVGRKGSAPRKAGTKMLVLPEGKCIGTIGGGCAEAEIFHKALYMSRSGKTAPSLCRVDMTAADAEEKGMVCGGVIDVLLEVIEKETEKKV